MMDYAMECLKIYLIGSLVACVIGGVIGFLILVLYFWRLGR